MPRFVIDAGVALHLAEAQCTVPTGHALFAPTLLRSQVLARLYADCRAGRLDRRTAEARLGRLRGMRIRLLGDRVLQSRAWSIAEQLGWDDTATAEYLALTQLQADFFVTLDAALARAVDAVVPVAGVEALLGKA